MGWADDVQYNSMVKTAMPGLLLQGRHPLIADAGVDGDGFGEPYYERWEDKSQWRRYYKAGVSRHVKLMAEVYAARCGGRAWPANWTRAKWAQYWAGPRVHAEAMTRLRMRGALDGLPSRGPERDELYIAELRKIFGVHVARSKFDRAVEWAAEQGRPIT